MTIEQKAIDQVVTNFYDKVNQDPLLSPIFNDVAQVDWANHIPKLCRFWHTVLCKAGTYKGNPYQVHMDLANQTTLRSEHFQRWLALFEQEASHILSPQEAQMMVQRAKAIAHALQKGLNITPSDTS